MGKYTSYSSRQAPRPRSTGVHPLMRGIGCIMMVVVPILAWGVALWLVEYGVDHGWPIPPNWLGRISIHPLLLRVQGLVPAWNFLMSQERLIAHIIFAVAIMIVIGGLMSMIYGYIYSIFGPPRYGPQDAPPIRGGKIKRYKR